MKVKELIKELEKFDEEMEVQYDDTDEYNTVSITKVYILRECYDLLEKNVVALN